MAELLYAETLFPEEDYNWLEREAKRRKISIAGMIDEIMGEFEIDVPEGDY